MHRISMVLLGTLLTAGADVAVTFTRGDAEDSRMDRLPALSVRPGEPATPFLEAGAFGAVWSGKLIIPRRQRLSFSFEGEGSAVLSIGGKEILSRDGGLGGEATKPLRLNPGEHDFQLRYRSKEDGSGTLRVYWEERGFPRQTIPPSAFKAETSEAITLGELQRAGRLAFTQNHCAKCHAPADGFGPSAMPETGEIGPVLAGIGERVSEEWLQKWIADPKSLKPTTHMPALVDAATEEGRQQSADLAAYLVTLKLGTPRPAAPDASLAQAGGLHFHELGCVACHTTPDTDQPDTGGQRVPLNNVASKFLPGSLVTFLKKPDAFHPYTGMPDFNLTDDEAAALAAYLTEASAGKETKAPHAFPAGDAGRGAKLAESLHCGVCHPGLPMSGEPAGPSLESVFQADWSAAGCAAPEGKRGKSPALNLTDADRAALAAFSKTGAASLKRDNGAEFAQRQTEVLRCTSCHAQDGRAASLDAVHAETKSLTAHASGLHDRVDQTRPQLTFIGEMLHASYIESMLAGKVEDRPRPWLGMRMPSFRAHAGPLAQGFARMHGVEPGGPPAFKTIPELVEIGRMLAGADGFGCTTCHGIGDEKPTAAFEVEGVNFKLVPGRLREEFYHRWMDNPQSVTPGSKMPRYAEGDRSQRGDVLEGDAYKQYEALWHFIHSAGSPEAEER